MACTASQEKCEKCTNRCGKDAFAQNLEPAAKRQIALTVAEVQRRLAKGASRVGKLRT